ncbi:hypothetical protein GCM10023090_31410 [Acidovorax lacteus]|uniref:Uncharacterized protein n=1 Tax=Acidovorax lacteus TaxID=1924988 RepID=A0ABP8LJL2_9BURK
MPWRIASAISWAMRAQKLCPGSGKASAASSGAAVRIVVVVMKATQALPKLEAIRKVVYTT